MTSTEKVTISRYTIELTHPDLVGPFVVDVTASTEARAVSQARGWAVRMYEWPPLFDAATRVIDTRTLDEWRAQRDLADQEQAARVSSTD